MGFKQRVVTWNVLSSALSKPETFTATEFTTAEFLDPDYRLRLVLDRCGGFCDHNAVVCLQEVSREWKPKLDRYFKTRGYSFSDALYGKTANGGMGVYAAWPSSLSCTQTKVSKIGDSMRRFQQPQSLSSMIHRPRRYLMNWIADLWTFFTRQQIDRNSSMFQDVFEIAASRNNLLQLLTLRDNATGSRFVLANYHMPCMYFFPEVMTAHAVMATHTAQAHAREQSITAEQSATSMLPLIFCGDFNFTPRSFPYACITCGSHALNPSSPHLLQHKKEIVAGWQAPDLQPMASMYAAVNGAEPDYTNNCVQLGNYFCDTLDYIFASARVQGRHRLNLSDALHRDLANFIRIHMPVPVRLVWVTYEELVC